MSKSPPEVESQSVTTEASRQNADTPLNQRTPAPNRISKGALTSLLHYLMTRPQIYDMVQWLVGGRAIQARLRAQAHRLGAPRIVLDLGGGTGSLGDLWPGSTTYVCLDLDPAKLGGFRLKQPTGTALLADATRVPIRTDSVDAVVCVAVTHHLTDKALDGVISESRRVLRDTGTLVLLDAIWEPSRWIGRLLWRYDRGANPRPAEALTRALQRYFIAEQEDRFALLHEYVLWVGRPRA